MSVFSIAVALRILLKGAQISSRDTTLSKTFRAALPSICGYEVGTEHPSVQPFFEVQETTNHERTPWARPTPPGQANGNHPLEKPCSRTSAIVVFSLPDSKAQAPHSQVGLETHNH